MQYKDKKLPLRRVGCVNVTFVSHEKIILTIWYVVRTKKCTTRCKQEFELSLCDVKVLGYSFQRVYEKLAEKLEGFKRAISD